MEEKKKIQITYQDVYKNGRLGNAFYIKKKQYKN